MAFQPPQSFPPSGPTGQEALNSLAAGGQPPPQGGPMPGGGGQAQMTGEQRSAMAFLDSAQELLQAAVDNMPQLAPAVEQATTIIASGLQNIIGGGAQSAPQMPPPQAEQPMMPPPQPQGMPGMSEDEFGGAVRGAGPEDIMMRG